MLSKRSQSQKNTYGYDLIYMKFKNSVNIYCDRNQNSGYLEWRERLSRKGHMGTLMCIGNVLCLDVVDGYVGVYVCQISS